MPRPLPQYVRDDAGQVHYRGTPEYDAILVERAGGESRLDDLLTRFEALVARNEQAVEAIAQERARLEQAAADLLQRVPRDPATGGDIATR